MKVPLSRVSLLRCLLELSFRAGGKLSVFYGSCSPFSTHYEVSWERSQSLLLNFLPHAKRKSWSWTSLTSLVAVFIESSWWSVLPRSARRVCSGNLREKFFDGIYLLWIRAQKVIQSLSWKKDGWPGCVLIKSTSSLWVRELNVLKELRGMQGLSASLHTLLPFPRSFHRGRSTCTCTHVSFLQSKSTITLEKSPKW